MCGFQGVGVLLLSTMVLSVVVVCALPVCCPFRCYLYLCSRCISTTGLWSVPFSFFITDFEVLSKKSLFLGGELKLCPDRLEVQDLDNW